MTIGKAVKGLLDEKGLSQRQLAEMTKIDEAQLSRILKSESVTLPTIQRIEQALGAPKGLILVRSGLVDLPAEVRAAIEADPKLNESERELVLTIYDRSVAASRKRNK